MLGLRAQIPAHCGLGCRGVRAPGSPAGTGVAGLSAAGWRRGWRGGGPGLERAGEGPREHLRPCGCGCLSPAGGPGQVPGGGARARGAGCTSCVGRSPFPRRGEPGWAWGPAEPGKELSILGLGVGRRASESLFPLFLGKWWFKGELAIRPAAGGGTF